MQGKYDLVRSVGEECVAEGELAMLMARKPDTFVLYDGFEPSGRMHIAQVCTCLLLCPSMRDNIQYHSGFSVDLHGRAALATWWYILGSHDRSEHELVREIFPEDEVHVVAAFLASGGIPCCLVRCCGSCEPKSTALGMRRQVK